MGDGEREIELVPDALVEITIPSLRKAVTDVEIPYFSRTAWDDDRPRRPTPLDRSGSWGFVDEDRFLLAVDVSRYLGAYPDSELAFAFLCGERSEVIADVELVAGMRRSAVFAELPFFGDGAPLDVRVVRPDARPGDPAIHLAAWIDDASEAPVVQRDYDWGRVVFRRAGVAWEGVARAGSARVPELTLGTSYRLHASDPESGAAGSTELVHTGAPVTVTLRPGVTLRGELRSRWRALPDSATAHWSWPGEEVGEYRWVSGSDAFDLEADGSWTVVLPRRGFPGRAPPDPLPPAAVELSLEVPGFLPVVRTIELHGRYRVDLGAIELEAREPDFSLGAHPLLASHGMRWTPVRIADDDQRGTYEVGAVRESGEGDLAVFLSREEGSTAAGASRRYRGRGRSPGRPFPSPPPRALVLLLASVPSGGVEVDRVAAFRLASAARPPRYEPVATERFSTEVEARALPGDVGGIRLGWEWRGVVETVGGIENRPGVETTDRLAFHAPASATFWWTWVAADGAASWPPVSSLPLDDLPERMVID